MRCPAALTLVLIVFVGCGRDAPPPVVEAARPQTPTIDVAEVLALRPETRTILRPIEGQGVLVGQPGGESKTPALPLRILHADGETRRAPFDGEAIAARLGVPAAAVVVRDALPLDGGVCVVFVSGFADQKALAGVWVYRPADRTLTLAADTRRLGQVSGLADAAAVADGRLIAGDREAWLWLESYGQTAVVRLALDRTAAGGPVELRRVDSRLTDDANRPLPLGDASVWPVDQTTAVWVRPGQDERYRIDLATFTATSEPGGLPPLEMRARGRRATWAFAPTIDRPQSGTDTWTADAQRFPVFTLTADGVATAIDRDGLRTRLGFPTHALRLTQWCPDPATGRVLAYDAMSGEVLRLSRQ